MRRIRNFLKPVSLGLVILMTALVVPAQPLLAAMVDTASLIPEPGPQHARDTVCAFLQRADIRQFMISHGIDPAEAAARVDCLTDEDISRIAERVDQLPAGGEFLSTLAVIGVIFFLTLLILDMSGVTDIFSFINPPRR